MVKEEITIGELLDNFNLKIDLPDRILLYEISSDFLKAELTVDKKSYTFIIDEVTLIINPKNKRETIKKLVIMNGIVRGGVIIGYDSIQYLN